jgi:hypothetical protein
MSAFPFPRAGFPTVFFFADGIFLIAADFFTETAFFAAGFTVRVIFFLVAVTVFFLAAAATGAFFAALFFAFGTAFTIYLHHRRVSLPGCRKNRITGTWMAPPHIRYG